jgi:Fe-S-cluster containining protein
MECKNCGTCCNHIALEIDDPEDKEDIENLKWYLCHEDVWVFIDDDGWNLQFNTPCKYRDEDESKCTNYEKRPDICKEYSSVDCECNGLGQSFNELFTSVQELEDYIKENNLNFK